jgi:hypothetical protein
MHNMHIAIKLKKSNLRIHDPSIHRNRNNAVAVVAVGFAAC